MLLATTNEGKLRELRSILADLPMELVTPAEAGVTFEVEEDGASYLENARKKAVEIARHTGKWALADDSGLEVDALKGEPGIYSARWSGAGDEGNNDKLLRELKDVPPPARTARYRAVVVVADPTGKVIAEADGSCEGLIGFERKGKGGFGYDPLFVVPQFGCTMAELPAETKHSISHRGEALRRLLEPLTRALGAVK